MCFLSSTFSIRVATSPHTPASESQPLVLTIPAINDCHCYLQMRKQRLRRFMWLTRGHEVRELKTQRFEARSTGSGQSAETRSKHSVPCSVSMFFGARGPAMHRPLRHAAQWASFLRVELILTVPGSLNRAWR